MSEFKFWALNEAVWQGLVDDLLEYDEGLRLKEGKLSGEWTSDRLDSGIPECEWHRLALDADIPEGCRIEISFCTFESSSEGEFQAKSVITFEDITDSLIDISPGRYIQLKIRLYATYATYLFGWDDVPGTENDKLIDYLVQEYVIDPLENATIDKINDDKTIKISADNNSILLDLNDEKTRVILNINGDIVDELVANMEDDGLKIYREISAPVLEQAKVYYPHSSLIRYLPSLYQDDSESKDLLERFLSVFETELLETEEMIDRIPALFDPMAVPEELLSWLASWLSLDLYELLGEKNREFLLKAMALYQKKGTVSGLGSLVSFLTGKTCGVREYANLVFRSYGMEHESFGDYENPGNVRFYHKTSKTVDTSNGDLLGKMGTFFDEVHYTMDTREGAISCPWGVGIYIYLEPEETLEIDPKKLYPIIQTFLPVFVHVRIISFVIKVEVYSLDQIEDGYSDFLHCGAEEKFEQIIESYWCYSNWKLIKSYESSIEKLTNSVDYRTFHNQIIPDKN